MQLRRGSRTWRSPSIASWNVWLEREAFRELPQRPLRASEEWLLWRQVLAAAPWRGDAPVAPLLEPLRHAARLVSDWRLPRPALKGSGRAESELLAQTLEMLEAHCRELGALPSHRLAVELAHSPPAHARPWQLAGFGTLTPVQEALSGLWSGEPAVSRAAPALTRRVTHTRAVCAADAAEELELAAEWCRRRLESDPAQHLLVIVPDLARSVSEARRIFSAAVTPRALLHADDAGEAAIQVEGGRALSDEPTVRHMLRTWQLLTGALAAAPFGAWLRCDCWREPEAGERAQLDAWLQSLGGGEVRLARLREALTRAPSALQRAAARLGAVLAQASAALGSPETLRTAAEWCTRLRDSGKVLVAPAAAASSRFEDVLADFTALSPSLASLSGPASIQLIEELARRTLFEIEPADAAVTLSDSLVDPIVEYDGIWVTGLHAERFPPPLQVNAFIPPALQLRAGIPEASPAGALAQARAVLGRLQRCSGELMLSWPARDEDFELLASPLLSEFETLAKPSRPSSLVNSLRAQRRIEAVASSAGMAWTRAGHLPGGTQAFELQSRCSFRAYAELRLGAERLEVASGAIDPRLRGRVLHRALELLWRGLGDSAALHAAHANGTLSTRLQGVVAQALAEAQSHALAPLPPALARREAERATLVLAELTELERARPAFRARALERASELSVGGALIDVRVDRLDELDDGTQIIFDYKSGHVSRPQWLQPRPSDPQLLVYLHAATAPVAALALVELQPHAVRFRGQADSDARLPRVESLPAWPAQLESWRHAVARLAQDFLAGGAQLDPVEDACEHCHLHAFCRIAGHGRLSAEAERSEGEEAQDE